MNSSLGTFAAGESVIFAFAIGRKGITVSARALEMAPAIDASISQAGVSDPLRATAVLFSSGKM